MMKEVTENRSRWLKVRLKPSEYEQLEARYRKTAFQNLSEFGRAMILGEPVTIVNRDRSMDDTLEELAQLRRELNAVGNNLNQAVRNINSTHENADGRLWMSLLSLITGRVDPAIQQIKERITQFAGLWSQRSKAGRT